IDAAEITSEEFLLYHSVETIMTEELHIQQHRWDIEEEFEALIEQGHDGAHGLYVLSEAK
ncbi:DUF1488 domain-containing protein, partial [Providencia huashanensis]|uniref:DUF1488 domain-containing protein n=1 Tax=Providencia huashanensis TaxID=3037798 RepID=UPI002AFF1582